MIRFKNGVFIYGLSPASLWAIDQCHACSPVPDITVTGARFGEKHSRASLHYVGNAFDLRTRHLGKDQIRLWIRDIKGVLGENFDVVFEGDHIHVEFQPKGLQEYPHGTIY